MNTMWKGEYTLRAVDFDKYGRLQPAAILGLFQDAAGQHSEELGLGFDAMLERCYLWVLIRVRFDIFRPAKRYQKVIIKTWPLSPTRLSYRREYCMEDTDGNTLVSGSSEWVVMHSQKRRLLSVPDLYPFTEGFCKQVMFEGRLPKVPDFEADTPSHTVSAGFSELDMNNHVNNTKYANFIMDAVAPAQEDAVKSFQIDYRKEVLQGTKLHIHYLKDENGLLAKGLDDDGTNMFACSISFQKQKAE
ncbi:MAG: hypothetical protein IKY33_04185 [Clostridia bacterium]|nr:hypothetical protein [Clostridia bacterium]